MSRHAGLVVLLLGLTRAAGNAAGLELELEQLPALPEPVSNNAVALLPGEGGVNLVSMQGLSAGRAWTDIHNRAWRLAPGASQWQPLGPVSAGPGRLAGVAAVAGGEVWLFGGYTVAGDGSEQSAPGVFRLQGDDFTLVTEMPVPVDDMTAFGYRDRYVYLVSGWHDRGNVNLVQVLDTHSLEWAQATPYPGTPVFGHAGGMSENRMLVCDGVRIGYPPDGASRQFLMSDKCWLGTVDADDYRRIAWQPVPAHPGPARYRMAAVANDRGQVVFAGGTDNPYNYNGIGYDGRPSEPQAGVFRYDLEHRRWESGWRLPVPSMDHRSLLHHAGWYYLVGGMTQGQSLSDRVLRWRFGADP